MCAEEMTLETITKKKKCPVKRMFRLVKFGLAVYGAITAMKKIVARLTCRLEEDNEIKERKRFLSAFKKREIDLEGESFEELEIYAAGSVTEVDLSEAVISGDVQVSVYSAVSKVFLKVPPMVRVELEQATGVYGFKNLVPAYETEEIPVVRINAKCLAGEIKAEAEG